MGNKQKNKEKNTEKQVKGKITKKINKKDSQPQLSEPQLSEPQLQQPQLSEPQLQQPQLSEPEGNVKKKKVWPKVVLKAIFITFLFGIVIGGFLEGFFQEIGANTAIKVKEFLKLPDRMTSLEDKVEGINKIVNEDHESLLILNAKKDSSKNANDETYMVIQFSDGNKIESHRVTPDILAAESKFENEEKVLGIDSAGISKSIKECQNTPLFIPYTDDDSEIYFSGQYNKNNHLQGECIFNIYKENRLSFIFEGIYDDGILFSYKSVFIDSNGNWRVNDRVCEEKFNSGETWTYRKSNDYDKPSLTEDVTSENILRVDSFLDLMDEDILSYYSGNTCDGLYNDKNENGKTYYVEYFLPEVYKGSDDQPVIRTLYNGKFENGKFKDDEYGSWSIARETNTTYMYFKGCFDENKSKSNGSPKERSENYLSFNRINELLEENHFTYEYIGEFFVDY